jgi:hypothetical protein
VVHLSWWISLLSESFILNVYVCFVLHVCVEPRTVKLTNMVLQVLVTNMSWFLLHFLNWIELLWIFYNNYWSGIRILAIILPYFFTFHTLAVLAITALKKNGIHHCVSYLYFWVQDNFKANSSGPNFGFVVFFICFCFFYFLFLPLKEK